MKHPMWEHVTARGTHFLNTQCPIICGGMTWVSSPELVTAVSNAGCFGFLAAGNMPPEMLEEQIEQTQAMSERPFGVNLIAMTPEFPRHLDIVERMKPRIVTFAGGLPFKKYVTRMRDAGIDVLAFAPNLQNAMLLVKRIGVSGLILEGMEAGGHIGSTSLSVLLQEVLFNIKDVPVFAAGGISSGKMIAHLLIMGVAGVQLGTLFAATEDSLMHPHMKEAFVTAEARDARATPSFSKSLIVMPVRAIWNKGSEDFEKLLLELVSHAEKGKVDMAEIIRRSEEFWAGKLRSAVVEGDVEHGSLMAGQSVGAVVKIISVAELVDKLVLETNHELAAVANMVQEAHATKAGSYNTVHK